MKTVKCKSGIKGWRANLQKVYSSLEDFINWCDIYNNHIRLGFETPKEAWDKNPVIEGSTEPSDYRIVRF